MYWSTWACHRCIIYMRSSNKYLLQDANVHLEQHFLQPWLWCAGALQRFWGWLCSIHCSGMCNTLLLILINQLLGIDRSTWKFKWVDWVILQGNDLQGVKAYFNLDSEGLYTLGTAVIDYRGYRVTAQSIIPGL